MHTHFFFKVHHAMLIPNLIFMNAHGEPNENKPSYKYDRALPENTPSLLVTANLSGGKKDQQFVYNDERTV